MTDNHRLYLNHQPVSAVRNSCERGISKRGFLAGSAALLSAGLLGSAVIQSGRTSGLTTLPGSTMGTYFRLVFPSEFGDSRALAVAADERLARLDGLMSTYKRDSEVTRFNVAEPGQPVVMSQQTNTVLDRARAIADLTNGAFDITVGPLVNAWGFGASTMGQRVPEPNLIAKVSGRTGMDGLRQSEQSLWKTRNALTIDLSGIAKGYAVDQLAVLLESFEVSSYLVDIGGELRAKGQKPDGSPWRVGIEEPFSQHRHVGKTIRLQDAAIATSGDYRNFFVQAGQTYSHVFDPRTAKPVEHNLASVTVVSDDAMTADALSTALMVMGPSEGYDFAQRHGIPAFFVERVDRRLSYYHTSALSPLLL